MANEISKIYTDIAELLNVASAKAYHTVNSIMVETYWKIGQRIVEEEQGGSIRAEYGTKLIKNLSKYLTDTFGKGLFINRKHVTNTVEEKMKKFNNIQDEDKPTGYIYVLQSRSRDEKIKSIRNLYKIGYCETTVAERTKNAAQEPTYLMAPVKLVAEFKTYNMNTQKFEDLLHRFLGQCQISIDVFDNNGSRHTPREWFQVPYEIIEQAVKLIVTGEVVNYRYDRETKTIQKL